MADHSLPMGSTSKIWMTFAPYENFPEDAFSDFRVADLKPDIHVVADIDEGIPRAFSVLHRHPTRNSMSPSDVTRQFQWPTACRDQIAVA